MPEKTLKAVTDQAELLGDTISPRSSTRARCSTRWVLDELILQGDGIHPARN